MAAAVGVDWNVVGEVVGRFMLLDWEGLELEASASNNAFSTSIIACMVSGDIDSYIRWYNEAYQALTRFPKPRRAPQEPGNRCLTSPSFCPHPPVNRDLPVGDARRAR